MYTTSSSTHHQVANDDSGHEKWDAGIVAHKHTVPHALNPLPTQHPEHNHEGVHEVGEVPSGQLAVM